jgi:replicative DNA helicase
MFRQPAGRCLGNSVGKLKGKGFDVRGNNGVVVVAPNPDGRYWDTHGSVPVLPASIADQLPEATDATEAATDAEVRAFIDKHAEATNLSKMKGWQAQWGTAIGSHASRHNTMAALMPWAMEEIRCGYVSAEEGIALLRKMFLQAKTQPYNGEPPMPETQARAKFDSILAWGIAQANQHPIEELRARRKTVAPPPESVRPVTGNDSANFFGLRNQYDSSTSESNQWGIITGDRFILDQPKDVPALWGTGNKVLWSEGEGLMIAGVQGIGKTSLAAQLVRAMLGLSDDVLGLPVKANGEPILYLAMDRPRQIARCFARQFNPEERDILHQLVIFRPGPPPKDIARNPEILLTMATDLGARTVFIDSVKDAALRLSDDEVGAGYNRARQYLLADDREMLDLHHTVKRTPTGGAVGSIEDIYGSTWLTAGCGSVVLLTGEPGDPIIKMRHVKTPAEEVGPWTLIADEQTGAFSVDNQVDLMRLAARNGGITARNAAALLFETEKPTGGQVEKARRRLDQFADAGKLFRHGGGDGRGNSASWSTREYEPPASAQEGRSSANGWQPDD